MLKEEKKDGYTGGRTEVQGQPEKTERKRKKVEPKEIPSWGGRDQKEGEETEGVYLGSRDVVVRGKARIIHDMYSMIRKEVFNIWGVFILDQLFANVRGGDYVYIKFTGWLGEKKNFAMDSGGADRETLTIFRAIGNKEKEDAPF